MSNTKNSQKNPDQPAVNESAQVRTVSKKKLAIGFVVLVIVSCLSGYALWKLGANNSENSKSVDNVKMEKMELKDLRGKVDSLQSDHKYDGAKQLIKYQDYYNSSLDARFLLVSVAINQGNHNEALEVLQQTESSGLGKTAQVAVSIALQAEELGDKDLAIKYYEKAISLTEKDSNNPVKDSDIRYYNKKINNLKR